MALTFKGPSNLGIQDDYTKSLRDLGAQAPKTASQFATKTGALEPATTAALISAGATIISTLFGIWSQPDQPKVDKEEDTSLKFQGKETMPFQSTLRDPGPAQGMMADTSTNVGVGGAPRATALQRIRSNYQLPTMLS